MFIGTVEFSLKALQKLVNLDANIVGVVTKEKSDFNTDFVSLAPFCKEKNIPFCHENDINSHQTLEWIRKKNPDIIFCFGWSQIIKKELLDLPKMGIVGFHPAFLPQNRGRHPLIWALALGLKNTASTFFFMDSGADSGDILSQKEFEIRYEDDAKSLYEKMSEVALNQIEEFLPLLQNASFKAISQDHKRANIWRKRGQKDGVIDFRMSSNAIYNLVRALSRPYVGASVFYNDEEIKVWKVREEVCECENIECGKVLKVKDNHILVKCYGGAIWLLEHEFKSALSVGEYL